MRKWQYFIIMLLLLQIMSCSSSIEKNETIAIFDDSSTWEILDSPQIELPSENTDLDGYITLFDGKSLKGWRGYNSNIIPENWCIENGCLKNLKLTQPSRRGDLIFSRKFKNFELSIEWKLSPGSESGIFYMISEIKGLPITASSLNCQLSDDTKKKRDGKDDNSCYISGSLTNLLQASTQNSKPTGFWNHTIIRVVDGVVVHYQNGIKVLEYTLWTPQWQELISKSPECKNRKPEIMTLLNNCGGDYHDGYIGLQDLGEEVWFKNIKIKILA